MSNGLNDQAFAYLSWNDCRPSISSLLPATFPVQPQSTLDLVSLAVTGVAFTDKQRSDLFFKERNAVVFVGVNRAR